MNQASHHSVPASSALPPAHLVGKACKSLFNQQFAIMAFPTLIREFNQELIAVQLLLNAHWDGQCLRETASWVCYPYAFFQAFFFELRNQ
jgi:hypothetical protein